MNSYTRAAFILSIASLATGFALAGEWIWLVPLAANSALGILTSRRGWTSAWLLLQVALIAASTQSALLALLSMLFALTYWDLEAHQRVLKNANLSFGAEALAKNHYRSLLAAFGTGSLLGLIAIGVQIQLSFLGAILLAALALLSIALLSGRARSASS